MMKRRKDSDLQRKLLHRQRREGGATHQGSRTRQNIKEQQGLCDPHMVPDTAGQAHKKGVHRQAGDPRRNDKEKKRGVGRRHRLPGKVKEGTIVAPSRNEGKKSREWPSA